MPTYEYHCKACDHEFERVQRITEDPVKTCPSCKKRQVQRLISQTSFVLKGGGWYNDLYASKKASKDAADTSAPSEGAGDAKDTKDAKDAKEAAPASKKDASDTSSSKDKKKSKGSKAAA